MPVAWIPSLLQSLTSGQAQVEVQGDTVRAVIDALDAAHPGIKARLCTADGGIKPEIAVAVDGEITVEGPRAKVDAQSEIHFLPALSGG